ncbi:MAG: DNA helicase RecQ [Pseudanabaena sp. CoA8_M7]|jgi:ATP-dependent DNA helicase RecQ|uniref:DNA helicase RecQ n=1 Tax=Pseudanabaena mucicola TaxID=71190 RepID=UPI002578C6AB|nr:DNA helicase RecQ [Pseudanabaena mucicola]MCA6575687.1 DNA helicase RecQ [Pseudanabaena sp. M53BS1SP1A06MG]MCA6581673.1 DNA helicase RecQ [Pseudanabaena sp. M34BS1SP1A06MG]MCA6586938.1 DNA helicase RecQ [Pseudanabaena sp. M051S1SP1A06QC]MCA6589866.1 DNA helicase RecQ [Pseudanabaena sp. M109S1SP1A06QC]MCA6602436.1 DNA helicase RecQ [Pseudanabaena sp. M57BS1SP1A06MG]MCE2977632.1 DNA helicase RecQ [Pseudanabaena sp. CoA8_M7]
MTSDSLQQTLKQYFGYDSFRAGQREIIEAHLAGRDTLAIMPTGGGKSICFQLPALLKDGVTIVVSPLIALMQDQVTALKENGIGATFLNSTLSVREANLRSQAVLDGVIKLTYVAPERLFAQQFIEFLKIVNQKIGIAGFAIDEAHCVSEWGHDFRPEYRQLRQIRQLYPDVPVIGLTATATERVREDISQQLGMYQPYIHVASFNRTNLYYEVIPKQGTEQSYLNLLQQIKRMQGSGIVYCLSRKRVTEIAERLREDGIAAIPYHAGLSAKEREENQTRWIRDDVQVMVATIAFGMGINKPDVRFVIHYDLPRNIEGYYQESGRAGRDGEDSHCTLFLGYQDLETIKYLIAQKVDPHSNEPLEAEQRIAYQQLRQVVDYAEGVTCRRAILLRYFGENFHGNCRNCDNCLTPKPMEDWTVESQKFLSCVARTKERFGAGHIIDVLRGSRKEKVLQHQHDQLSTYGIGKDRSLDEWRQLSRSLLHQGYLTQTTDGYAILKLNDRSWEVMRGQRNVLLPIERDTEPATVVERETSESPVDVEILFKRLRLLRKNLADGQEVPPYVIFSNATLNQMAEQQPTTRKDFAKLSGVGAKKLEQYADDFIAIILEHHLQYPPAEPTASVNSRVKPESVTPKAKISKVSTQRETLAMYENGLDIDEIARDRGLKPATVWTHLTQLLESGYAINIDRLVSPERQNVIYEALEVIGGDSLRNLFDHLREEYTYDEIKVVRAIWQNENEPL